MGGGGGEILGMAADGGVSMPPMSLLLRMRSGREEIHLSGVCGGWCVCVGAKGVEW